MPTEFIPATKARQNFFKLIAETAKPGRTTAISVDGKPKVVMMSYEDFEGWMETIDIMSDPQLMQDLREAEEDYKEGRVYSLEEVRRELEKEDKKMKRKKKTKK